MIISCRFVVKLRKKKIQKITVTLKPYLLDRDLKSSLPVRDHGLKPEKNNKENIEQITIEREDKIFNLDLEEKLEQVHLKLMKACAASKNNIYKNKWFNLNDVLLIFIQTLFKNIPINWYRFFVDFLFRVRVSIYLYYIIYIIVFIYIIYYIIRVDFLFRVINNKNFNLKCIIEIFLPQCCCCRYWQICKPA